MCFTMQNNLFFLRIVIFKSHLNLDWYRFRHKLWYFPDQQKCCCLDIFSLYIILIYVYLIFNISILYCYCIFLIIMWCVGFHLLGFFIILITLVMMLIQLCNFFLTFLLMNSQDVDVIDNTNSRYTLYCI